MFVSGPAATTSNISIGSAMPLSSVSPSPRNSKYPSTSRRVSALTTIASANATPPHPHHDVDRMPDEEILGIPAGQHRPHHPFPRVDSDPQLQPRPAAATPRPAAPDCHALRAPHGPPAVDGPHGPPVRQTAQ